MYIGVYSVYCNVYWTSRLGDGATT